MSNPDPSTQVEPARRIDLPISGMTCAACAQRIETVLNRLPGVEGAVNLAAERARRGVLTARLRERCLTALDYLATLPDPPIGKGAPYDGYVTTTGMSRFATPGSPISR